MQARGLSASAISRDLGVPRSTVRDWLVGRVPTASQSGDLNCTACGSRPHEVATLPASYSYLLGVYLGDGYIAPHSRGVYRLRLTLDAAYPGIIQEAAEAVADVLPTNKVAKLARPDHSVEVSSYSKSWPCLFPQHGPGKKHLRPIHLTGWQEELVRRTPQFLIRGLIHSDGCRFMNTGREWRHPRYSFKNFSSDIRRIFTDACDQLGLALDYVRLDGLRVAQGRCGPDGSIYRTQDLETEERLRSTGCL